MGNSTKLVSRSIRAERITPKPITKYFDGNLCLGSNLTKAAVHFYGYTKTQLAQACHTEVKNVRQWYTGKMEPNENSTRKLLRAIEVMKNFKKEIDRMPKISLPAPLPLVKKAYGVEALGKKVDKGVDQEPLGMDTKVNPASDGACATQNPLDPAS